MLPTDYSGVGVPPHVPPELVWDHNVDVFPMQFEDPYVGTCEALHAGPDIVWASKGAHGGRPGWLLTRFEHLNEVYADPERFSAAYSHGAARFLGFDVPLLPTESDPPQHHRYRMVLQPHFSPTAIKSLEMKVHQVCEELMGRFADQGECEFVEEFSSLFPSYIILELLGLPREKLPEFFEWEHAFLRGETWDEQVSGTQEIYRYLKQLSEERRRNPGDDIISRIVTAEIQGRELAEREAVGMCMTLYLGGLDTVMNSLGWCMRHLARDQDLQRRLRADPDLIPVAVEELLRAYAVTSTFRTVMADFEFHDVFMRRGDIVALPTFFAGRDKRVYSNPHEVDIDRKARHLSFGGGAHICLGLHLARRELRIVLETFLKRFNNIRIAEDSKESWTTVMIWGINKLPLVWDR